MPCRGCVVPRVHGEVKPRARTVKRTRNEVQISVDRQIVTPRRMKLASTTICPGNSRWIPNTMRANFEFFGAAE